jgi:hypothetical protein
MCCSLLDPGWSWCVGALSHTVTEKHTTPGAAAKELENTQQADSKKEAHHTPKGNCEVKKVQNNKSAVDGLDLSYQTYFIKQTVPREV